jgi:hypothetical protein
MTNLKLLQSVTPWTEELTLGEVAKIICVGIELKCGCGGCPFEDKCYKGHNGVEDFLKQKFKGE